MTYFWMWAPRLEPSSYSYVLKWHEHRLKCLKMFADSPIKWACLVTAVSLSVQLLSYSFYKHRQRRREDLSQGGIKFPCVKILSFNLWWILSNHMYVSNRIAYAYFSTVIRHHKQVFQFCVLISSFIVTYIIYIERAFIVIWF